MCTDSGLMNVKNRNSADVTRAERKWKVQVESKVREGVQEACLFPRPKGRLWKESSLYWELVIEGRLIYVSRKALAGCMLEKGWEWEWGRMVYPNSFHRIVWIKRAKLASLRIRTYYICFLLKPHRKQYWGLCSFKSWSFGSLRLSFGYHRI